MIIICMCSILYYKFITRGEADLMYTHTHIHIYLRRYNIIYIIHNIQRILKNQKNKTLVYNII